MKLTNPQLAQALLQRALDAHRSGNLDVAALLYGQVLAQDPRHFDSLHLSGVIALQKGDPAKAVELIGKALRIDPKQQAALSNRAAAFMALNNPAAALKDLNQAVALKPGQSEAHYNRGKALLTLARPDEALPAIDKAIALNPGYVDAHITRGTIFADRGEYGEALACYDRALALDGQRFEAHFNRAYALTALGQDDAAIAGYTRVLELQPGHVDALNNRGNLYRYLNRHESALADYARAGELAPDFARVHVNRALCLFALGHFDEAWAPYEARFATPDLAPIVQGLDEPRWYGREPLGGKSILLVAEQGLGDTLQFCRFAQILAAQGAVVRLMIPTALKRLLSGLAGIAAIYDEKEPRPTSDFYCPLLSVPLALGITATTIPDAVYLNAEDSKIKEWAERLSGCEDLRVGLVWAGNPQKHLSTALSVDPQRSLPLAAFAPLGKLTGINWISLQKGEPRNELPALRAARWAGPDILDLTEELRDFADTAALVANLDVVISCDTAVGHLAGGMGKPVWILNRAHACWRYPIDRTDSPWYPTARVFHQPKPGDWDAVIAGVAAELAARQRGRALTPFPRRPG
ncbi:MAG: tetratricopeptide repeat protein [Rhodospirillaceae bacterium]